MRHLVGLVRGKRVQIQSLSFLYIWFVFSAMKYKTIYTVLFQTVLHLAYHNCHFFPNIEDEMKENL